MKKMPTIELLFAAYIEAVFPLGVDPMTEEQHRIAFFAGFEAGMTAMDALAELLEDDAEECEKAWQKFWTELEQHSRDSDEWKPAVTH